MTLSLLLVQWSGPSKCPCLMALHLPCLSHVCHASVQHCIPLITSHADPYKYMAHAVLPGLTHCGLTQHRRC